MAKTPKARRVQYRVRKKCFINGVLEYPGAIVEGDEGLEGAALELVPMRGRPPKTGDRDAASDDDLDVDGADPVA